MGVAKQAIEARQSAQTPRQREIRKPRYVAFAKIGNGWERIGAAWDWKSGEEGLSIQLNTLPLNFDGRFILAVPNAEGEVNPPED